MGYLYKSYIDSYFLTKDKNTDFFNHIENLYWRDELQGLKIYPQHGEIDRLKHITSVAYLSYVIAKKLKLNVRETVRGAILHDLFYYDWHENDWSHRPHGYRHPGFALKNAKILCKLSKKEENIIKRHMWPLTPVPPKYKEAFVVSIADKYCAYQECMISWFRRYNDRFKQDLNYANEGIKK